LKVSLLTGGGDKPYALGLLNALVSKGVIVDFIGNDEMSNAEIVAHKSVNFLNLRGNQNPAAPRVQKITRVLRYYLRLIKYTATTDSPILHILWFNKFLLFDRTLLNIYYKFLGKKLVFTAHNIDEKERDGGNNYLNRLSLKILYNLVDHIFVHTAKMKSQLVHEFNIAETKVSVIPFGINNTIPKSDLTKIEARGRLHLKDHEKVLLFFGNIAPYKGLEYVMYAMDRLRNKDDSFRLIIAGQIKDCQAYWEKLELIAESLDISKYIIKKIEYIPDEDVEVFFKSSDVLLLPYKFIYQSGVLFLSYSFGLPVIATDVGSLREDIMEGKTGMICRAEDPDDLADKICRYFDSDLFRNLEENQKDIINYGNEKYSWDEVGNRTHSVYGSL
jgi:glycosyltransferase involved in cell wall biosynthesis